MKALRFADELDACPSINYHSHAAELRRLNNEVVRLNDALQREQDRSGRIGTHGPGCHLWGHRHHECLEREYKEAIDALRAVHTMLVGAHLDANKACAKAKAVLAKAEGLK